MLLRDGKMFVEIVGTLRLPIFCFFFSDTGHFKVLYPLLAMHHHPLFIVLHYLSLLPGTLLYPLSLLLVVLLYPLSLLPRVLTNPLSLYSALSYTL